MSNVKFLKNDAIEMGGCIYLIQFSSGNVTFGLFEDNRSTGQGGGALVLLNSNLGCTECELRNNTAARGHG